MKVARQDDLERRPLAEERQDRDVADQIADHGPDIGQANAFARLILNARAPEGVERALPILLADPAAGVCALEAEPIPSRGAGAHVDPERPVRRPILYGIVQEVAE